MTNSTFVPLTVIPARTNIPTSYELNCIILNDKGELLIQNHIKMKRLKLPSIKVIAGESIEVALKYAMHRDANCGVLHFEHVETVLVKSEDNKSNWYHLLIKVVLDGNPVNNFPERHADQYFIKPTDVTCNDRRTFGLVMGLNYLGDPHFNVDPAEEVLLAIANGTLPTDGRNEVEQRKHIDGILADEMKGAKKWKRRTIKTIKA